MFYCISTREEDYGSRGLKFIGMVLGPSAPSQMAYITAEEGGFMNKFTFLISLLLEEFCDKIIQEMIICFKFLMRRLSDRVDQEWDHIESITKEDDMIFHMTPKEWAYENFRNKEFI